MERRDKVHPLACRVVVQLQGVPSSQLPGQMCRVVACLKAAEANKEITTSTQRGAAC